MKRTETLLARERRHETRVAELEAQVAVLNARLDELAGPRPPRPADHG
jgi:hypothetical protein